MWLERLSNQPTPSASPSGRDSFQGVRRSSQLAVQQRPGFSPRSSSLNVHKPNGLTSSFNSPRLNATGSTLRQEIALGPDLSNPLAVLEQIVGKALSAGKEDGGDGAEKPENIAVDIDFRGKSLEDFVETAERPEKKSSQIVDQYVQDGQKFEDLHKSILACDDVLKSVETSLLSFQNDLGAVSAEIETLQNRSTALNTKLENRRRVEKLLGPAVEEISIAPSIIRKIVDGSIDQEWLEALRVLQKHSAFIESKTRESEQILAIADVKPLLEDLTNLALERCRDFLVSQIKSLRSPNINAQIIQQRGFLAYKDIFVFLASRHPKLAEEIGQAYINTMRWYYSSHFTRYKQALEKASVYVVDKTDALGADPAQKTANVQHSPAPLMLGRRIDIVTKSSQSALPSHVIEDTKTAVHLEGPFHAFNTALIDNATFEYAFLTSFFINLPFSQLNAHFTSIFAPVFALGDSLTKDLIDTTYDCFGILLCVRITQNLAFELQRRKCPAVDSYVNGTNMLLWPRFQIAMDVHVDSLKRATSSLPSSSARATLSLDPGSSSSRGSTAPHMLTQRFAQFLQGILSLVSPPPSTKSASMTSSTTNRTSHSRSNSTNTLTHQTPTSATGNNVGIDTTTTPLSRSLDRLRTDFETFLEKAAKPLGAQARRERFLGNNYGLVRAIVGDLLGEGGGEAKNEKSEKGIGGVGIGPLAEEVRAWLDGRVGEGGPG